MIRVQTIRCNCVQLKLRFIDFFSLYTLSITDKTVCVFPFILYSFITHDRTWR